MTRSRPVTLVGIVAGAVLALAALSDALAQSPSPKKRSSFPTGIEARDSPAGRIPADGPMAGTPAAGHGSTAPGAAPASARMDGGGGAPATVRIDGNGAVSASGSNVNTSSTGSGNAGCTTIGGIAGRGC